MSYHARMMNIQMGGDDVRYKVGHRDARHAAADIANEADAELDALRYSIKMERGKTEKADADNDRLRRELAEARRDAARYRWLRDTSPVGIGDIASVRESHTPAAIDEAIDAAMAETSTNPPQISSGLVHEVKP